MYKYSLRLELHAKTQCGANLARLLPNIVGPREAKRRLVASVVHSKLLYAAPAWASVLQNHAMQGRLFSAQRVVALTIVSAYRPVSMSAVFVLASVIRKQMMKASYATISRNKPPMKFKAAKLFCGGVLVRECTEAYYAKNVQFIMEALLG